MNKKLSWEEIKNDFSGLWVELVDCDWDWNDANPRSAKVRNFSTDRKKLIGKNNKDSVLLYIGSGNYNTGLSLRESNNDTFSQAVGY